MANNNTADPQITKGGRIAAGLLLVLFTVLSITILIAFWPDQLPEPGKKCALYRYEWFAMTLDTNACLPPSDTTTTATTTTPAATIATTAPGSITDTLSRDTAALHASPPTASQAAPAVSPVKTATTHYEYIHLNIIVLLLVAVGGFLGNMIHIATSFTTFIGAGKFRRSWVLWYWVRPFTAAALSLALYFAFGASNDPGNVDLDRILTVAILTGLFTDIATQKLKEVFDVIFAPKDNRPNKLTDPALKIDTITPDELVKDGANTILIKGKNLKEKNLIITIDNETITETQVTSEEISFTYQLPEAAKSKTELTMTFTDEDDATLAPPKKFKVIDSNPPLPPAGGEQ